MSEETKSNLFFGGIPTAPDVDALIEEFGVPEIGVLISYSNISKVIGVPKDKNRFKSVTDAWKKRLDIKHNVIIEAIRNNGFKALSPSGRVGLGSRQIKSAVKKINNTTRILVRTDKKNLSDSEKLFTEHIILTAPKKAMDIITAPKQLEVPELNAEQS